MEKDEDIDEGCEDGICLRAAVWHAWEAWAAEGEGGVGGYTGVEPVLNGRSVLELRGD